MTPIRATELSQAAGIEPSRANPTRAADPGFATTLSDAIDQARASERAAVTASAGFAAGDPAVGIHEVVIAAEEANISLRYATTLKNKVLEAYRELMSTQV